MIGNRFNELERSDAMWAYDELYSCPLVLVAGGFELAGRRGLAVIPLMNYRVNLLRRGSSWRECSNLPSWRWAKETREACWMVAKGAEPEGLGSPELRAISGAFFYGGLGMFIVDRGLLPVSIEPVNPGLYIYYRDGGAGEGLGLVDWIALGLALRTGDLDFARDLCGRAACGDGYIAVGVEGGELLVSKRPVSAAGYARVIVDNAPMRHVVKVASGRAN